MAVEDHPKYADWLAANDKLVGAFEALQQAIRQREPWHMATLARTQLRLAQMNYDAVADEMDNA